MLCLVYWACDIMTFSFPLNTKFLWNNMSGIYTNIYIYTNCKKIYIYIYYKSLSSLLTLYIQDPVMLNYTVYPWWNPSFYFHSPLYFKVTHSFTSPKYSTGILQHFCDLPLHRLNWWSVFSVLVLHQGLTVSYKEQYDDDCCVGRGSKLTGTVLQCLYGATKGCNTVSNHGNFIVVPTPTLLIENNHSKYQVTTATKSNHVNIYKYVNRITTNRKLTQGNLKDKLKGYILMKTEVFRKEDIATN